MRRFWCRGKRAEGTDWDLPVFRSSADLGSGNRAGADENKSEN